MIRSLSLSRKLIALGLIGVTSTVIAGISGYRGLSRLADSTSQLELAVRIQRSTMEADMMHDGLRGTAALARLDATNGRMDDVKALATEATQHGEIMIASIDSVRLASHDSLTRVIAERVRPTVVTYTQLAAGVANGVLTNDPSVPAKSDELEKTYEQLEADISALSDRVDASAKETSSAAESTSTTVRYQLLLLVVLSIVTMTFVARAIINAIREPISEMAAHASIMATGDFSRDVAYTSTDEIGTLAESFRAVTAFAREASDASEALGRGDLSRKVTPRSDNDRLSHSVNRSADALRTLEREVKQLIDGANQGDLKRRANANAFEGTYQELVAGMNTMLDATLAPVTEATSVLDQVAKRDLRVRVEGTYRGDHARLTTSLNTTLDQLEEALREVYVASEEVTSAADQIASGSQQMAEGASEQASSLEEINASLQELNSLSREGAQQANGVRSLADTAQKTATSGGEQMHRLNDAMMAIQASVVETSKIMRTIDEIAFQTNLLALNAAVEAARAGDAGRGFAVVAEEVRSLALRSANEAKRSAEVIERSLSDAAKGVELNQLTQVQFTEIASTVKKVSAAMDTIADGSAQQAEGIRQILAGTDQMNLVTQQAAANAEESAAAAQELTSQAESLHDMVGQFSISLAHASTAPSSRGRSHAKAQPKPQVKAQPARFAPGRPAPRVEAAFEHEEELVGF